MPDRGTVFLMYHELALPGRPLCHAEPGYARYVVSEKDFRLHMQSLASEGWRGRNLTQALQQFDGKSVCITFDDGCETDLITAAPILEHHGFTATSYIAMNFLGKPGYLSHAQVRGLRSSGFEIGCHSLTHPYLTDIDDARLRDETVVAKEGLEQICGASVTHFSCPGGRWDARVAQAVKNAGFTTMTISRSGVNSTHTNLFALSRVAVLDGTSSNALLRTCRGKGLWQVRLQEKAREGAKSLLGNSIYDSVRNLLLGK